MDVLAFTDDGHLEIIGAVVVSLFGILSAMLRYIFMKVIPQREKLFKEALASQTDSFERIMTAQADTFRSGLQSLAARQKRSSENIRELAEKLGGFHQALNDHQAREEEKLSANSSHLERIEGHLARLADAG